MAYTTQAQQSNQGLASAIGSSVTDTFNVDQLSAGQIVALVGIVLVAILAWRQVINFIVREI